MSEVAWIVGGVILGLATLIGGSIGLALWREERWCREPDDQGVLGTLAKQEIEWLPGRQHTEFRDIPWRRGWKRCCGQPMVRFMREVRKRGGCSTQSRYYHRFRQRHWQCTACGYTIDGERERSLWMFR